MATSRLLPFASRAELVAARYSEIPTILGQRRADGVLLDLGISSMQLEPGRGFSYGADGPLDMRMAQGGQTARELVESATEDELATLLATYGEVRKPRRVARSIKAAANAGELNSTAELRLAAAAASGGKAPPAAMSRVFQALRIAVNDELVELRSFLDGALDWLNENGRVVVISYHSLEDRIVKTFMREAEGRSCVCPPEAPVCTCGVASRIDLLTRRVVKPTAEEIAYNPRARSARLRAAAKRGETIQ